jgi:HK97 family phage major capsid protein
MEYQTSDSIFEESMELSQKAIAILKDVDNLDAENVEKAERISDAAAKLMKQSEIMGNLEAKRQNVVSQQTDERVAPDNASSPEMEAKKKANFGYKSFADYVKAIYHLKANSIMSPQGLQYWDGGGGDGKSKTVHITDSKALAENTGATGGFLVPQEFQARVLQVSENETVVAPRAETIRMNRREARIPTLDQTGTVSGGFSFFGGVVTYYAEEAGDMTESSMNFRDITLTAHNLTAFTRSSNQLLDDSAVSLEDFLMSNMTRALAYQADYDYLQGDGVGKPQGVIGAGATLTQNRVGTLNITYADLIGIVGKALPSANMVWVASQSVLEKLLALEGPSSNPSYLWGSAERGVPASLLGRPIIFTDKVPVLGTAGDIGLYDFSYYLRGDRQAITLDMSIHEKFISNQSSWRAIMRHDGQPWLSAPITYKDASTQVSPFVRLGDKST